VPLELDLLKKQVTYQLTNVYELPPVSLDEAVTASILAAAKELADQLDHEAFLKTVSLPVTVGSSAYSLPKDFKTGGVAYFVDSSGIRREIPNVSWIEMGKMLEGPPASNSRPKVWAVKGKDQYGDWQFKWFPPSSETGTIDFDYYSTPVVYQDPETASEFFDLRFPDELQDALVTLASLKHHSQMTVAQRQSMMMHIADSVDRYKRRAYPLVGVSRKIKMRNGRR
jgi:hypothetical protein